MIFVKTTTISSILITAGTNYTLYLSYKTKRKRFSYVLVKVMRGLPLPGQPFFYRGNPFSPYPRQSASSIRLPKNSTMPRRQRAFPQVQASSRRQSFVI
jgi:hypothetical protein